MMSEVHILNKIFGENITQHENEIKIETKYGNIFFEISNYPEHTPNIRIEFNCKVQEDEIKNKIIDYIMLMKEKELKFIIYPVVLYFYILIEERNKKNSFDLHLVEVNEITEELFTEWKKNRNKDKKTKEDNITGKSYFLSLERGDHKKMEY